MSEFKSITTNNDLKRERDNLLISFWHVYLEIFSECGIEGLSEEDANVWYAITQTKAVQDKLKSIK